MKYESALAIAQELATCIRPFCQRVEIAGSIRRGKSEVKDIEIVAIPRWEEQLDPEDLFGERVVQVNSLYQWATQEDCPVQWIKPGTPEVVPWKVEAQGRYWRGLLRQEIKLDLFLSTPQNYGAILLIRTGSREFSYAVATHAKKMERPFVNGWLTVDGKPVATPEEMDVFDLLELEWREPKERVHWQEAQVRLVNSLEAAGGRAETPPCKDSPSHTARDRFIWRAGDIEIINRERQD